MAACLEVGADFSVSWESLRLDSPPTAPVDLPDPLKAAHEAAESLIQRVLGLRPEEMHRIDLVGPRRPGSAGLRPPRAWAPSPLSAVRYRFLPSFQRSGPGAPSRPGAWSTLA